MFSKERVFLRRSVLLVPVAFVISITLGCGGGKGTVSGKVTLGGQPLPAGTIGFHPSKGTAIAGEIKDGQYSVSGVPAGEVKVTVETASIKDEADNLNKNYQLFSKSRSQIPPGVQMPPEAKKHLDEDKQKAADMAQKAKDLNAKYRPIPEKYSKAESSGLTVQVNSGSNTFDVPLSAK